jgi:malate dehydrogenase (oxaloacetate-decarboxylating)(NADP+)
MVARGEADAMVCGIVGRYQRQLRHVLEVLPLDPDIVEPSAMTAVQNERGTFFFIDTHVQDDPPAERIAEATCQAVLRLQLFGITPRIALLSHSNFGSHENPSACKMRRVFELVRARLPNVEIDGEMQADTALNDEIRARVFPNCLLRGQANVFVFPNLDAANIAYNMVRQMTDGVAIGPILMGISKPAHVLTTASTVRRVVNISAIACVEAQIRAPREPDRSA